MLKRAGLLTAALLLSAAPFAAQAEDCGTIQLGAAVSMTGIYAANGHNTRDGYDFAVKKVNDEGGVKIGGKCYKFEVKYYDDESNPARAAQLVERLIDQDHIQFMSMCPCPTQWMVNVLASCAMGASCEPLETARAWPSLQKITGGRGIAL